MFHRGDRKPDDRGAFRTGLPHHAEHPRHDVRENVGLGAFDALGVVGDHGEVIGLARLQAVNHIRDIGAHVYSILEVVAVRPVIEGVARHAARRGRIPSQSDRLPPAPRHAPARRQAKSQQQGKGGHPGPRRFCPPRAETLWQTFDHFPPFFAWDMPSVPSAGIADVLLRFCANEKEPGPTVSSIPPGYALPNP